MAKKKKRRFLGVGIGVIAAIALLAFALVGLQALAVSDSGDEVGIAGIEGEKEGNGGEMAVAASAVTNSINYQGRLTDSAGEPLSGTYSMTLRLYEVASGGTALYTDTHTVEVTDGLFNTNIDFDQSYFDGRELWLGIKVGADAEMTPRQELRPVPYALSLRPGAVINGSVSGYVLSVKNTYEGAGDGVRAYSDNGDGVYGYSNRFTGGEFPSGGVGVYGEVRGDTVDGAGVKGVGPFGVKGEGTFSGVHGTSSATGVYGYSSGSYANSYGVEGRSLNSIGVYGKGKYGGYFTTNQGGTAHYDRNAGVNVSTAYVYSDGVRAATSGYGSKGVCAITSGDGSDGVYAATSGDGSDGVYAATSGYGSNGVCAITSGDASVGVYVRTHGYGSNGVYAHTAGDWSSGVRVYTAGNDSNGVYAHTAGNDSNGVYAYSDKSYGVYGKGKYGGYFTTNQGGTWGNPTAGVNVSTAYDNSFGVRVVTSGENGEGIYAYTTGFGSEGVYVHTDGHSSNGVYAETSGDGSRGVWAYSAKSHAIYADTGRSDHKYGVYTPDYMYAAKYEGGGSDVAEYFSVAETPEPGIVMVIDPIGGSKLRSSTKAYDTTVAGIVSTAPGVSLGTNEEGNEGENLIAVAGRVPCKVDASYAPIMPGDLLTTSDTPGYAMKATNPQIGTILGKALEPLDSGRGVIEVLVTLQ